MLMPPPAAADVGELIELFDDIGDTGGGRCANATRRADGWAGDSEAEWSAYEECVWD